MQIDGYKAAEIRKRVPEIIKKVGLYELRNRKVSRLSGGQKQRVAIARALAKDTQILVADEPTGNLDSDSAEGIVELLTDIASDKLVIVVTHNFDQFSEHATRVIKMHDGKIVEDTGAGASGSRNEQTAREPSQEPEGQTVVEGQSTAEGQNAADAAAEHAAGKHAKRKSIPYGTQLRLGVRNTFNLPAKFILLLLVFLFVYIVKVSVYATAY
jgi:energy-coupling factor transporter ATP-binding protein EcfA2